MDALLKSPIQLRDAKGRIMKGNIPAFKGTKGVHKGNGMKGKKFSIEWRKNLSLGQTGKKKSPRSAEHRKKISELAKLRVGSLNSRWKGGISAVQSARRRERLVLNGGSHTLGEWQTLKAQYNWTCPCCFVKESERFLTKDHIIPVSKGGSNNIENIQPLCSRCNTQKHTKVIKY